MEPTSASTLQRLASAAQGVARTATRMVIAFGVAGIVLWSAPAFPIPAGGGLWSWIWRVGLLVMLLIPATAIQLFRVALGQLAAVPPQLLQHGLEGAGHAADLVRGVADSNTRWSGRLIGLLKGLYRFGRSSVNVRDTALGGLAAVRLFNPIVIVAVGLSVVAGFLVTVAAAVSVLFRVLV